MSRLSACRVCLSSELNMYAIADTPLQAVYEKLTGSELQSADARPACVCYICLHQLRKCDSFIRRAVKADTLLTQLAATKLGLCKQSIESIDRKSQKLKWMLKISKTDRLSTVDNEHQCQRQDLNPLQTDAQNVDGIRTQEAHRYEADGLEVKVKEEDVKNEIVEDVKSEIDDTMEDYEALDEELLTMDNMHRSTDVSENYIIDNMEVKEELDYISDDFNTISCNQYNIEEKIESNTKIPQNEDTSDEKASQILIQSNPEASLEASSVYTEIQSELSQHSKIITEHNYCRNPNVVVIILGNRAGKSCPPKLSENVSFDKTSQSNPTNKETSLILLDNEKEKSVRKSYKYCTSRSLLMYHNLTHTGKMPYTCELCDRSFPLRSALKRHYITHTNEKPFECQQCSQVFKTKAALNRHLFLHTGEKPYSCDNCSYSTATKYNLVLHNKIHTGEKPYKCEHCSYTCTHKHHLVVHTKTHTGHKPFKCNICSYSSGTQSNLSAHIKTHSGGKPHACEDCSRTFARKEHLVRHIKIHKGEKPYVCDYCNRSFSRKWHLARHIKIHTGEKPYKCDYCKFSCIAKSNIIKHIRKHTNKKTYRCEYCDFSSTKKMDLKKHIRNHKPKKS